VLCGRGDLTGFLHDRPRRAGFRDPRGRRGAGRDRETLSDSSKKTLTPPSISILQCRRPPRPAASGTSLTRPPARNASAEASRQFGQETGQVCLAATKPPPRRPAEWADHHRMKRWKRMKFNAKAIRSALARATRLLCLFARRQTPDRAAICPFSAQVSQETD